MLLQKKKRFLNSEKYQHKKYTEPIPVAYYASALGGGIKRCFCLTSVCTSGLSQEQRGLERLKLAHTRHLTRDWTPVSRSNSQLVADVLNSQHARISATWQINTVNIVNLQGAEVYHGGRPPTAC